MPPRARSDVRMRGFLERVHPEQALAILRPLVAVLPAEPVAFDEALGRTLAEDVVSAVHVPAFARSAVDGYGLHAEESFGAAPSNPMRLRLTSEMLPGRAPGRPVGAGEAVRIMTGAAIPPGVDAVIMAEHAEEHHDPGGPEVWLSEAVPPGKNVVAVGEDIREGDPVLAAGRVLRPQDIGVLASIDCLAPRVARRPVVAIATTGNELRAPGVAGRHLPSAIVNSNSYTIEGLVRGLGAEPLRLPIVPDEEPAVRELLRSFPGDVLVCTGGTSVGVEDYLPVALAAEGELLVHGINVRPGSPTGFGRVGERLIFLLPGNPVAAMVGFEVLVRPALEWLLGRSGSGLQRPRVRGRLNRKVVSELNRVDYVRARVIEGGAIEVVRSGGASVLSSMSRADGFLVVPRDLEGHDAGDEVELLLF